MKLFLFNITDAVIKPILTYNRQSVYLFTLTYPQFYSSRGEYPEPADNFRK